MMQRLMDVLRRDAMFYPLSTGMLDEALMWLVRYPSESVRVWYQPIEDEL